MRKLLLTVLLCGAISCVMGQESKKETATDVQMTLHNQATSTQRIPKEIYGHFAEHLGRCIYGGIWVGEESEIPNEKGYRVDVLEALRALKVRLRKRAVLHKVLLIWRFSAVATRQ